MPIGVPVRLTDKDQTNVAVESCWRENPYHYRFGAARTELSPIAYDGIQCAVMARGGFLCRLIAGNRYFPKGIMM